MSNPKLPLTQDEKATLRRMKVRIGEVHSLSVEQLSEVLCSSDTRTKEIKGLAEFQNVPSIGFKFAEKLVRLLKVYSLNEIKDKDSAELFDKLEQSLGVWTDSCVEDQIRCVIAFANNPASDKQWFDFTDERKRYRKKFGYPENRPVKAWYE